MAGINAKETKDPNYYIDRSGCFAGGILWVARLSSVQGTARSSPTSGEVETDVTLIRDWMTVSYIAQRYYVPGDKLFEAVKIPPMEIKTKVCATKQRILSQPTRLRA